MNRFLILILLFAILSCGKDRISRVSTVINQAEEKYAPDSRLEIYRVSLNQSVDSIYITGKTTSREAIEEVCRKLDSMGIAYQEKVMILPDTVVGEKTRGLVNVSVCNMRSRTSHSWSLTTQAVMGTPVMILEILDEDWYRVRTPDQYLGLVKQDVITAMSPEEFEEWRQKDRIVWTSQFGLVRDGDGKMVSDLVAGSVLEKTGETEDGIRVRLPDGREGYVPSGHSIPLEEWLDQPEPEGEKIISTAEMFLGIPYLWGGTSSKAFDCSGFTKTVYAMHGIALGRDASLQVQSGIDLEKDTTCARYQQGDLLFFGEDRKTREDKITHVAIYRGDGRFIHAASSDAGRVQVESLLRSDSLFNQERYDRFLHARRILGPGMAENVRRFRELQWY